VIAELVELFAEAGCRRRISIGCGNSCASKFTCIMGAGARRRPRNRTSVKTSAGRLKRAARSISSRKYFEASFRSAREGAPPPSSSNGQAGFLLPRGDSAGNYSAADLNAIQDAIRQSRYEPVELPWPPVLNTDWIARQRGINFALVDVGTSTAATGIVGYLHGAFTPSMRLTAEAEGELPLYSAFEAGYPKDIIRWSDSKSLVEGVQNRLDTLDAPRKRITADDGLEYFRRAAKRKEAVFISYAGADADLASSIAAAFAKRFQKVFDYRDGKSIRPGEPWLSEIFDQLAVSPIGIPLLSPAYVASGNCAHELREMIARRDSKAMQIFP
jgi:hypothetical protein